MTTPSTTSPIRATALAWPTHFNNPKVLVEVSRGLGEAMVGIDIHQMAPQERLAGRGV